MQDGPRMGRPGFVSLIPGGQQRFPHDPVGDAARDRRVKRDAQRLGIKLIRRRPKESSNV